MSTSISCFEDWDDAEWQKFFEFMMMCVWEFLTNGLQEIKYDKQADNFRAYFSNDVLLQEFERIMPAMRLKIDTQGHFTTIRFPGSARRKIQTSLYLII